jgi:hypothetical protein
MRLIHYEVSILVWKDRFHKLDNLCQGRQITIHAVDRLHTNEDGPVGIPRGKLVQDTGQITDIIMLKGHPVLCSALPHAIMYAGMDQLIVNDDISFPRKKRENANIRVKTGVGQKSSLSAMKLRELPFQVLSILRVTIEESRPS